MLRPRLIPTLLIHNKGLVKTVKFSEPKYVGDPLNAVRIFNEKEVDEIIINDIDATVKGYEPNYSLIADLARECRMPLCYGGGVKTVEQVERLISLGVEKVSLSSVVIKNPNLISQCVQKIGSQSIVVVMDVKETGLLKKNFKLFTHNGKNSTNIDPLEFAKSVQNLGAGEIVINSIDRDGTMSGYNFKLVDSLISSVEIPITILGGAGSFEDIKELVQRYGIVGAAAGSLFLFKGKYRAVLIQYPDRVSKDSLHEI
jgi:cyclase